MKIGGSFIFIGLALVLSLTLAPFHAESQMSSDNYFIEWDTVGNGGKDTSSSTNYKLRDSFGTMQGESSSASYIEEAGYRAGVFDQTSTFEVMAQLRASQVGATSLSGNTVGVTTTSGYSVGNYIVIVQNEGATQVSAMGKVISVGGSSLTVDELNNGGVAPTIDGSNDFVYKLSGNALPFSTLSSSLVSTAIVGWESDAEVFGGYSVYVYEDHDLTTGVDTIADVADGDVTAGVSEYGARSSDTSVSLSTFDTADTAFTTTPQQVSSRTDESFSSRDFLTLKTSIDAAQPPGSYAHNITLIFVGNY